MVPVAGLEPAQYRYRGILSPLCLPIPPHRRASAVLYYHKHASLSTLFSAATPDYCFNCINTTTQSLISTVSMIGQCILLFVILLVAIAGTTPARTARPVGRHCPAYSGLPITIIPIKGGYYERQCEGRCADRSNILYFAFSVFSQTRVCHYAIYRRKSRPAWRRGNYEV